MADRKLRSTSAIQTEAIGAELSRELRPSDVVLLCGGLGLGKTTFVRGVARGLSVPKLAEVASPTFALHHRYEGGRVPIDHLDLYRIEDALAAARQGLLDALESGDSVVLVEWPERVPELFSRATWVVRFATIGEFEREIEFTRTSSALGGTKGIPTKGGRPE